MGEVFDALNEIRIKSISEHQVGRGGAVSIQLPKYRYHKEVAASPWPVDPVGALKIRDITDPRVPGQESDGSRLLHPVETGYAPICVSQTYMRKHDPQVGGYYVVYSDGYASWSPAKAFEEGYARI
ncbi:MAG: hypothetical protein ACREJC_10835 [Tepidisphaeraceae bacterium]